MNSSQFIVDVLYSSHYMDAAYDSSKYPGLYRSVEDLEERDKPTAPSGSAAMKEKIAYKLQTSEGKRTCKKREEIMKLVFEVIRSLMDCRQSLLQELDEVSIKWDMTLLGYNMKRLYRLTHERCVCLTREKRE